MTYYLEHADGTCRTPCGDPDGYADLRDAHDAAMQHGDLGAMRIMALVMEVVLLPDGQSITEGVLP